MSGMARCLVGVTAAVAAAILAVGGVMLCAASAQAAGALTVTATIAIGSTQAPLSGDSAYPTLVVVGSPTVVVTVANGTTDGFTLTAVTSLTLASCDRVLIAPGESAVCTGPVAVAPGLASGAYEASGFFAADPSAVGVQASVPAAVFGVVYDLQTVFFGDFPSVPGGSAPSTDPRFRSLPLGYLPTMHVGFVSGSNVSLTGLARSGFATGCASLPASLPAGATIPQTDCTFTAATPVTWQFTSITVGATAVGALGDIVETSATLTYGPGEGECATSALTVGQGERITVNCFGFLPGIDVAATLNSAPVALGTKNTGSTGDFRFSFVVPADLDTGSHRVGLSLNGTTLTMTDPFTVTAPLAPTGASSGPVIVGAVVATLLGIALVSLGFSRRRNPRP